MPKAPDWVVVGGKSGETAHCQQCGEGLSLGMPVRVEVMVAASKAFVKCHRSCRPGQFAEPIATTPEEWVAGRDIGTSSLTIYSAITGMPSIRGRYDVPHDPADFGRCSRLLKLFPSWREQLHKVVELCPAWAPFVAAWDELQAMYDVEASTGMAHKMYDRMQQLAREKP